MSEPRTRYVLDFAATTPGTGGMRSASLAPATHAEALSWLAEHGVADRARYLSAAARGERIVRAHRFPDGTGRTVPGLLTVTAYPEASEHDAAMTALTADLPRGLGSPLSEADQAIVRAEQARIDAADAAGLPAPQVPATLPAEVCSDCLVWAANRDDSGAGSDWSPRAYANGLDMLCASDLIADGEACGFQWAECPVCRIGGGGDRFAATLVLDTSTPAWQVNRRD